MKSLTTLATLFYFVTILFYYDTIQIKSLTLLTTLFYFTTIKMKSLTMLTTVS